MTKELTVQEMEDILFGHEMAELAGDLEGTMATVSDNPSYEFPFHNWLASGREAVHEHYRRTGPNNKDIKAEMRVHAYGPNTLVREAWTSWTTAEGETRSGLYCAIITFDPETRKVSGERLYTDAAFGEFISVDLLEDYGETPGVTRLTESAPTIAVHDAWAKKAERDSEETATAE